jgi:exonuclease SbcD
MIKFLHCADLHLDSPLSALDIQKAEIRRNEIRAAFTSLTLYAQMNKIDFLIISGDLFDTGFASKDTIAILKREFANIPDCRVIITPGNHDPYTSQSYYKRTEFSDNVYIFDSSDLSCFDFPDKNTTIYGYAFTSDKLDYCPFENFKPENPSRINILAAHGELGERTSNNCPIPVETIAKSGFDYVALGHYHNYAGIKKLGSTNIAYSGCLEGRGFDELGPKGAIIGAADKENGQLQFGAKFVRFSKRHYEIERLDVTGSESNADVTDKLSALINEKHYGDDTALRVILTGNVASGLKIAPSFLCEQFPRLFLLEILDETLPLLDGDRLKYDPTIRGAFYNSLAGMLNSSDEKERELAALALRYGFSALSGGDIVDF